MNDENTELYDLQEKRLTKTKGGKSFVKSAPTSRSGAGTVNLNATIIEYPQANLTAIQALPEPMTAGVLAFSIADNAFYQWNGSSWVVSTILANLPQSQITGLVTALSGKMALISAPTNNHVLITNNSGQGVDSGVLLTQFTQQGNTFNTTGKLVQLTSDVYPTLPIVDSGATTVNDPTTSSPAELNVALANIHAGGGAGTVTNVSVASANGMGGTVATSTTTPDITLTTSVNGVVKGNGTAFVAAVANTDYLPVASPTSTGTLSAETYQGSSNMNVESTIRATGQNPPVSGSGLEIAWDGASSQIRAYNRTTPGYLPGAIDASTLNINAASGGSIKLGGSLALSGALGTGILKNTTSTGELSIASAGDFPTLNQNTTGSAAQIGSSTFVAQVDTSSLTANRSIAMGDVDGLVIPQAFEAEAGYLVTGINIDSTPQVIEFTTDGSATLDTGSGPGLWQLRVNQATTSQLGGSAIATDSATLDGQDESSIVTPNTLNSSGCLSNFKAVAWASGFSSGVVTNGAINITTGATQVFGNGTSPDGTTGIVLTPQRQFDVFVLLNLSSAAASSVNFIITGTNCTVITEARGIGASTNKDLILKATVITSNLSSPTITVVASGLLGGVQIINDSFLHILEQ